MWSFLTIHSRGGPFLQYTGAGIRMLTSI
jgi:hypothetical protein